MLSGSIFPESVGETQQAERFKKCFTKAEINGERSQMFRADAAQNPFCARHPPEREAPGSLDTEKGCFQTCKTPEAF